MKRLAASLALALPLATLAARYDFRVWVDGEEVGTHRFAVEREGDETRVRSEARFTLRVLFIDAYRYEHRADERWRGDCLVALDSNTQANGERESVRANLRDGALLVEGNGTRRPLPGCQMTFAYWNPAILGARRLLNSQTGELTPVAVTALGEEPFALRGRNAIARRHRIQGPGLAIDLWYVDGEWVGLESRVRGGRVLRYRLS